MQSFTVAVAPRHAPGHRQRLASSFVLVAPLALSVTTMAQVPGPLDSTRSAQRGSNESVVPCEALTSLELRDTKIMSATFIPGGSYAPPDVVAVAAQVPGMVLTNMPAFCRVIGTIYPSIGFEMWLPIGSAWNGKFAATGSGGSGGYINYAQGPASKTGLAFNIRRGYAVAATNQGHVINTTSWLLDPGLFVDWAFRANHEVAVRAKAIIKAHYGSPPKYSYFEGCSAGGWQGLIAAQRYPLDFDGIVAGAPGNGNFTARQSNYVWGAHAVLKDPGSMIPAAKLTTIRDAAMATCDSADGLVDGIISNPPACAFNPKVLLCNQGDSNSCLTLGQILGLRKLYQGAVNPRTGERLHPGYSVGGELSWGPLVRGPLDANAINFFSVAVFENPSWDWTAFDFGADPEAARAKFAGIVNSDDPDLRPFRDRGGKLLMWHGWADQMVPSQATVDYYNAVIDVIAAEKPARNPLRATQSFARLFMNPGVAHCTGGVGADNIDLLPALEQWVEQGVRPDRVTASKIVNGVTQFTRPLCPYPGVATYIGGNPNAAESFACRSPQ